VQRAAESSGMFDVSNAKRLKVRQQHLSSFFRQPSSPSLPQTPTASSPASVATPTPPGATTSPAPVSTAQSPVESPHPPPARTSPNPEAPVDVPLELQSLGWDQLATFMQQLQRQGSVKVPGGTLHTCPGLLLPLPEPPSAHYPYALHSDAFLWTEPVRGRSFPLPACKRIMFLADDVNVLSSPLLGPCEL
jgi:hypothetical protein